ncbi:MAG: hypothetical protein ABIJ56_11400 [Pseudomonadota bacterium]
MMKIRGFCVFFFVFQVIACSAIVESSLKGTADGETDGMDDGAGDGLEDGSVDTVNDDAEKEDVEAADTVTDTCHADCGNGSVECDEACDDGGANSDTEPDACRTDCTNAGCGDDVIDWLLHEQCDDGNRADRDGCSFDCRIEPPPTCGDGNVDYAMGEQCDDRNSTDGDGCSAACLVEPPATCGNGVLDLDMDEQCDDGNLVGGDRCSPACLFEDVGEPLCSNGTIERLEKCDDGDLVNGDVCNPTCNMENRTSLFVGAAGSHGLVDDCGPNARIGSAAGASGSFAVDDTHLYYSDNQNRVIRRIEIDSACVETIAGDLTGGVGAYHDDPAGLNASFLWAGSIATDGNTLWVADSHRIRAVDLAFPNAVTTVAGTATPGTADNAESLRAGFDDIRGLTYYSGWVYLVDGEAATLRRFRPPAGPVETLAGFPYDTRTLDEFGTAARFVSPRNMASDNSGMLYIADNQGFTIRSYNTVTTEVKTFAGNGSKGYRDDAGTLALVHRPRGMTSDGTSLYWAEQEQNTIRQGIFFNADVSTMIGSHCGGTNPCPGGYREGTGTSALLDTPYDVIYHHRTQSLFVLDSGNYLIRRIE